MIDRMKTGVNYNDGSVVINNMVLKNQCEYLNTK